MKAKWTLGLAVVVVLGICTQNWQAFAEGERHGDGDRPRGNLPYPKNVEGFSGQVWGQVVAKKPNGIFTFKVERVKRLWEDNKAADGKALEGKTINVARGQNKHGRPEKLHVKYIKRLEAGEEVRLEIKHFAENNFLILELDGHQRRIALGAEKEHDERDHWGKRRNWRHGREGDEVRREGQREGEGRHRGDDREGRREVDGDRGDRHAEGGGDRGDRPERDAEKPERGEGEGDRNVDNDYDD
jgi:hypothetical protein